MDDAESVFPSPPSTPQDGQSHQSETTSQTSQSDDVIIEGTASQYHCLTVDLHFQTLCTNIILKSIPISAM